MCAHTDIRTQRSGETHNTELISGHDLRRQVSGSGLWKKAGWTVFAVSILSMYKYLLVFHIYTYTRLKAEYGPRGQRLGVKSLSLTCCGVTKALMLSRPGATNQHLARMRACSCVPSHPTAGLPTEQVHVFPQNMAQTSVDEQNYDCCRSKGRGSLTETATFVFFWKFFTSSLDYISSLSFFGHEP